MIGDLVARLIAAGAPAEVAAMVVTEAFAAGAAAVCPQKSADESADKRREKDRIRKQTERENLRKSAESADNPQMSKSASISIDSKKESKRPTSRGVRIPSDWSPSDAERAFAKQEGFSEFEIGREANKFRDYWAAAAGAKGIKLDWAATWRQWIRNGAERAGKTPGPNGNGGDPMPGSYYAKPESAQLAAWDAYSERTSGKRLPRDKNQGWRVKAEWPPDYGKLPLEPIDRAEREAAE